MILLKNLDLKNKKVLMRVDFNVPLDEAGHIIDATRIHAALPTIQYIIEQGGALILMSHLGRPKGEKNLKYSLAPCAHYLATQLKRAVNMASDCVGKEVKKEAEALRPGEILLLENLRFYKAEEKPESDPSFAKELAGLADIYVNDAFGTAHRKHSSTYTITQYFPDKLAAGFLLEKELHFLGEVVDSPQRPFYALVGGAKISSKLGVLHSLLKKVDALFIGGAMSYTFMAAQNIPIGRSLFEPELQEEARTICAEAKERGVALFLPEDIVVTTAEHKTRIAQANKGFAAQEEGVDIGPKTVHFYSTELQKAKTIFWNGPFGKYEEEAFAKGTMALLHEVAKLDAITIIGGGDLVAASMHAGLANKMTHISTGGGATLEYIEKGMLPAIESLN